ncbi:MAG: hypothetical protein KatS3mg118_3185 [Paracoccaceae bacterium]|nr:MAG: hypothetical protein KatS3mg118_3185 [Paracoccaceae bacterium]
MRWGAHGAWKLKLRTACTTGALPVPAADVARDDACAFGRWLRQIGADPALRRSAHYDRVRRLHADFHRVAGRVAERVARGDLAAARQELEGGGFDGASAALRDALMAWRQSA